MRRIQAFVSIVLILSFTGVLESCSQKYPGSKALEKRKRRLKRKYKRNGINDCPVFDCKVKTVNIDEAV